MARALTKKLQQLLQSRAELRRIISRTRITSTSVRQTVLFKRFYDNLPADGSRQGPLSSLRRFEGMPSNALPQKGSDMGEPEPRQLLIYQWGLSIIHRQPRHDLVHVTLRSSRVRFEP
ncbi:hypothetical protein VNI00_012488 [Paramarasmius palmivorus]|uniref:Uncharacterized protein n=1 Tax=Paramarasmius palmivorus TaxID=297713 RepID=A0AAW0C4T4_9AGAR